MAKMMSYDDNLFLISEKVRILTECLDLDIDSDIFLDKTVDEILFVEDSLAAIYQSLIENDRLLNRADHLHSLMRVKGRYAHLLENLSTGDIAFGIHLTPFAVKFSEISAEQRKDIDEIRSILTHGDEVTTADNTVVSEEEFKYLLMDEDTNA